MSIKGVDFSHWQAKVSAEKLKKAGISFAIVKAGEVHIRTANKPAVTDPLHDRNITELKRADIICGDYYYFHPSAGAAKQARHYAAIRERNGLCLPPIIDIEDRDAMQPADVSKQIMAFIQELVNRTERQPIIYSRNGFLVNECGNPAWPAGTLFWIARYGLTIGDLSPKIKSNVVMWQYTDNLRLPGLPKMDGNFWMASDEALHDLAAGKTIMPPAFIPTIWWRIRNL
jgi:GH25 family lysozyme M1 (1,4-beta-N-acetylmuramidase)